MSRRTALLAAAACGVVLLAVGATPWLLLPASTALSAEVLSVSGSQAVPAVPAAGVVVLAAALALAVSGRAARLLAAGAVTLAGSVVVLATGALVRGPEAAARAAVASATGVRPAEVAASLTLWPVVAGAVGTATCAAGVFLALASRRWQSAPSGDRYERQPAPPAGTARSAGSRPRGVRAATPDAAPRDRTREDWDALSRGEDPS